MQEVKTSLMEADYDVAEIRRSGTVDLIAKSNDSNEAAILTKCVSQLDNFKTQHSNQMITLSKFIGGIPLLIANCYKNNQFLKDETLYLRHDINAINLQTLKNLLEHNISPYKLAMRGASVSVNLNQSKFKKTLETVQNLKTKNEISKELDISRQALSNYESGRSLPSEETFERLIAFFNTITNELTKNDFVEPVNIFDSKNVSQKNPQSENYDDVNLKGFQSEVNEQLKELNFTSQWFNHLPWNGVSINNEASKKKLFIFTGVGEKEQMKNLLDRIDSTQKVVRLFKNNSWWIIQDEKLIPELQETISNTYKGLKIYSFHDLKTIKKDANGSS